MQRDRLREASIQNACDILAKVHRQQNEASAADAHSHTSPQQTSKRASSQPTSS